jgi:hypothetical protein
MRPFSLLALFAIAFAACSSNTTIASCGLPPPYPVPEMSLAYPIPGSTNVPIRLGELIFEGDHVGATLTVESPGAGNPLVLGTPTSAPSPLPTPYATPSGLSGAVPYFAVPVPTLSAATTYSVSYAYRTFANNPPACIKFATAELGEFTTQ